MQEQTIPQPYNIEASTLGKPRFNKADLLLVTLHINLNVFLLFYSLSLLFSLPPEYIKALSAGHRTSHFGNLSTGKHRCAPETQTCVVVTKVWILL